MVCAGNVWFRQQWRHMVAWWDNTTDRLVPSVLMDVHVSYQSGGQDVLKGVLLLNLYEVYTVMEN